jgi:tetratricopeptide (TPR) repeat protein
MRVLLAPSMPEEKQVVVLPFRNTGGEPRQQVLCDGLNEVLTSGLTQLERFHGSYWVVPASEVRQTGADSVADARRVLGATLAITGSVLRDGERLLVTANLVDAASLRQLRATTFETAFDRITDLQDGLVRRVGAMLDLEIGAEEERLLVAGRTASADAYAAYLRGRGHLLDYQSAASLDAAIAEFQAALERDPEFALAHAGLGESYWRRYELDRDPAVVVLARRAVERAAAIDDSLAPVRVTLGIVRRGTGEPEAALEDLDEALRLEPGNALAVREKGRTLEQLGRVDEAEASYRQAIALRPGSWSGRNLLGGFLFRNGRYEEAAAEFRRVTEIAPDNPRGFNNLGGALLLLGRREEARVALERAMALQPTSSGYSNLGTLEFGLGNHARAARAFERAIELGARDHRVWSNLGAAYRSAPGEQAKAREAFARALELAREQERIDPRDLSVQAAIAECEAELGELTPARERIARALAAGPAGPEILFVAVKVSEKSGLREEAVDLLARAFDAGLTADEVELDPDLAGLRADPRYDAIRNRSSH